MTSEITKHDIVDEFLEKLREKGKPTKYEVLLMGEQKPKIVYESNLKKVLTKEVFEQKEKERKARGAAAARVQAANRHAEENWSGLPGARLDDGEAYKPSIFDGGRKSRKKKRTRKRKRKTRRRKKGGDTVLEKLLNVKNKVMGFKNKFKKMKDVKDNATLAKNTAIELGRAGIKAGKNAVSKMKTTKKKITPCTAAAVADRIACSEKYFHTSSPPEWRSPEWFKKEPEHSKFLEFMCQNSQNITNTLQPGNFDYFKSSNDFGCQTRTGEKLLKTSKEIDRKSTLEANREYLKLSPEERKRRNEEEREFKIKEGIDLTTTEQKHHILAGQKQNVLGRKGRGKKHWSKKAKKEKAEKKKAEAEDAEALERMRMPAVGEGPALPSALLSQEQEKLVAENQKRREERKLEQQQKIQRKRRNQPKTKKAFGQQMVVGGKRKRRKKTRKRRKRKTKRRR